MIQKALDPCLDKALTVNKKRGPDDLVSVCGSNRTRTCPATSIGAEALRPPLLVSVEKGVDEIPATGGHRRLSPSPGVS